MKTIRRMISGMVLGTTLALGLAFPTQAGQTLTPATQARLRDTVPLPGDLQLISSNTTPSRYTTYYSIQRWGVYPPYPCNWIEDHPELPMLWSPSLGPEVVFIDDSSIDYAQRDAEGRDAAASGAGTMAAQNMGLADNGDTESGNGSGSTLTAVDYPPGSLWLQVLSVSTNVSLALNNAIEGTTYEILSTEDLSAAVWQSEGTIVGTNQPWTLATVTVGTRTNLFLRARSCDGGCGNALPIAWEMEYFGQTGIAPDGDYDGDGVSNYGEYVRGTDPNKIAFSSSFADDHFSGNSAEGTISVTGGVPAEMTFLIDSTNASSATWIPFSPSFSAPLPAADGRYWVWVGLRGRSSSSRVTWDATRLTRDSTPPLIAISNSIPGVTTVPMLQLQGFSPEPLSSLRYDVSNAACLLTDQQGLVSREFYDTNLHTLTTNFFQCYDIDLTNGANTITVRATDLAGNVAVTNFTYTLVSGTNPPGITLGWPEDGMSLCGASFSIDGRVSDPTAKITASLVDTSGNTNLFAGLVERDGRFWVENLPLADGQTTVIVSATDAWGNTASTNITLAKSGLGLSISPVDVSQLYQDSITVQGAVGDAGCEVWVNGVQAVVGSDGSWQAAGVPVNSGGTASFEAVAYPPEDSLAPLMSLSSDASSGAGAPGSAKLNVDKEDRCFVETDSFQVDESLTQMLTDTNRPGWWWSMQETYHYDYHWNDGKGGSGSITDQSSTDGSSPGDKGGVSMYWWMAWSNSLVGRITSSNSLGIGVAMDEPFEMVFGMGKSEATDPYNGPGIWRYPSLELPASVQGTVNDSYTSSGQTTMCYVSGGKGIPHKDGVLVAGASASRILDARPVAPYYAATTLPIAAQDIRVGDLGKLASDNMALGKISDNSQKDITPKPPGKNVAWNAGANASRLVWTCVATTPTNQTRTTIGIAEQVDLSLDPPPGVAVAWSVSGGGTIGDTNGPKNQFTAPGGTSTSTCTVKAEFPAHSGQSKEMKFQVKPPKTITFERGTNGVWGQDNPLWLIYQADMYVSPDDVSFYNVDFFEDSAPAVTTGYFTNRAWEVHPANGPTRGKTVVPGKGTLIGKDTIAGGTSGPTYADGTFVWTIPCMQVTGTNTQLDWYPYATATQRMSLDAGPSSATLTITKEGATASRTIRF